MVTKTIKQCDVCGVEMAEDDNGRTHFVVSPTNEYFQISVTPPPGKVKDLCLTCRVTASKNDPVAVPPEAKETPA